VGLREARKKIELARNQLERVQVASWSPPDPVEAVTWAFYAYENAVVAVAEAKGIPWTKNHAEKARLARRLVEMGILQTDVEEKLITLNELRKDVAYGEPGFELQQVDLEYLSIELENFVDEVERVIDAHEEAES
jgi:uncharacterized protein (UPF0332 family)